MDVVPANLQRNTSGGVIVSTTLQVISDNKDKCRYDITLDLFVFDAQLHQFGGSLHWNHLTEINDCTAIRDQCAVRNKINMPRMPRQNHVENDCCQQASSGTLCPTVNISLKDTNFGYETTQVEDDELVTKIWCWV